jgi:hypothetical protein
MTGGPRRLLGRRESSIRLPRQFVTPSSRNPVIPAQAGIQIALEKDDQLPPVINKTANGSRPAPG